MKRRKASLSYLYCSLSFIAIATFFYSKYIVENECLTKGKPLKTLVVDKKIGGGKAKSQFLVVKSGQCIENVEVSSSLYEKTDIGDTLFFTGILEDCNFCYSVANSAKENKIVSYIVYFFALVLLIRYLW